MRPLTDEQPKPLLRVGGKRLIEYHLERLSAAGFREVVINTGWLGDKIEAALGTGGQFGLSITYSHERPEALETGGGIFKALPLLGSAPFLLVWRRLDGYRFGLCAAIRPTLAPGPRAEPTAARRGDFLLENSLLSKRRNETDVSCRIFRSQLFAGCRREFPLLPLRRAAERALSGELHSGRWYDIGTTRRLAALDVQLTSTPRFHRSEMKKLVVVLAVLAGARRRAVRSAKSLRSASTQASTSWSSKPRTSRTSIANGLAAGSSPNRS
jgi:MurNAc alpha-1-phosphate uridylyltransferase